MIFGVDVSSYQSTDAIDGYAFVICNARDPGLINKVNRAISNGIPWGVYEWINPGTGTNNGNQLLSATRGLNRGEPPLGYWFDYEQANVVPEDLSRAIQVMLNNNLGSRTGYYCNAGTIDHSLFLDYPWWYAAYPGNNDGSFPGFNQMANPMPRAAVIWQYSSTNGTLDRNVIVDEAWYTRWNGGTGTSRRKGEEMVIHVTDKGEYWFWSGGRAEKLDDRLAFILNSDTVGLPKVDMTELDLVNLAFRFPPVEATLPPIQTLTIPTHLSGTITGTLQ